MDEATLPPLMQLRIQTSNVPSWLEAKAGSSIIANKDRKVLGIAARAVVLLTRQDPAPVMGLSTPHVSDLKATPSLFASRAFAVEGGARRRGRTDGELPAGHRRADPR